MTNEIKIPSNHKLNERLLIEYVHSGEWTIIDGKIWCNKKRLGRKKGGVIFYDVEPYRIERLTKEGYLSIRGSINGKRYSGFAHRLIWQYYNGDIINGLTINHKDGNKTNNVLENLELATYLEQSKHSREVLGNIIDQYGEKNPSFKLKDSEVISIREMYMTKKYTQAQIGELFGVAHQTISIIVNGDRRDKDNEIEKKDNRNCLKSIRGLDGRFLKK
jgi:hypothetical protein